MEIKDEQELVKLLKLLAHPLRLRIIASLSEEPKSVYTLAKELGKSYPLIHLYLKGLRKSGLVILVKSEKRVESLPDVKYYKVKDFKLTITPSLIRKIVGKVKRNG